MDNNPLIQYENLENRLDQIRVALENGLSPTELKLTDDSESHKGHAGAQGGGHYSVEIVSTAFEGMSRLQRHRLVYYCLKPWIPKDIHALIINAKTIDEK
jgi:BolA protein